MKISPYVKICLAAACLSACGSGEPSIDALVRQKAYDGEITADELAELQDKSKLDCDALIAKISEGMGKTKKGQPCVAACERKGGGTENGGGGAQGVSKTCNVYVENSASMFGYMDGNTQFREVLMDLPSRLEEKGMKNNFFFINDKPYPVTENFREFISAFNPQSARKYGKTDASVLDKMLDAVVNEVIKTGNTAIFASDFIYDIGGKNPQSELLNVKFTIKTIFARLRAAGDYGVLALRFNSNFKGTYYDYKNGKVSLNGEKRPFYVWIIGKNALLQTFEQDFRVQNLAGFEHSILFYAPNASEKRYLSILPQTEAVGSFSRPRNEKGSAVTSLEAVSGDPRKDNMIQFAVAVDMDNVPVSTEFLENPAHYDLASDLDVSLLKVLPIDKAGVHKNDERFKGKATHVLIFSTRSKLSKDEHKLNFSLRQVTPDWVAAASTDDDTNIKTKLNKTFGLTALFNGLAEAYIPSGTTPHHVEWSLSLKK